MFLVIRVICKIREISKSKIILLEECTRKNMSGKSIPLFPGNLSGKNVFRKSVSTFICIMCNTKTIFPRDFVQRNESGKYMYSGRFL